MFTIERPYGRSAHGSRVKALRALEEAGIIIFHRAIFRQPFNRRHYLITHNDQVILLRDNDIEPYVIGLNAGIKAATGHAIPGLELPEIQTADVPLEP